MENVARLIGQGFNVIGMDTEYPGFIYSLHSQNYPNQNYWYEVIKNNVNDMNLIQIGISLSDKNGIKPEGVHTWQFNLQFALDEEKSAPDSISILKNAGIDFDQLKVHQTNT
jgi:CCR4-NOT transcription complex subunit 7/8